MESLIATLLCCTLAACGATGGSGTGERFVDSDAAASADDWQAMADAIMADGTVTRAETEQAIASHNQCLAQHHFSGSTGVDLDIYFWSKWGSYGLDPDAPGYPAMPAQFDDWDDPAVVEAYRQWSRTPKGKARDAAIMKLWDEYEAPCKVFDQVRDLAASQVDWAWYDRNEFDAIIRCIAANAPSYAERARSVPYRSTDTGEGMAALRDEFYGRNQEHAGDFMNQPEGSEAYKLDRCFYDPTGVRMTYFGARAQSIRAQEEG